MLSSELADAALRRARAVAGRQNQVAHRRQLYAAGVPRWLVRRELRVGRWQRTGRGTVALHNGPLDVTARRWVAVLECGPSAALSGVSALQHDGITALTDDLVHVVVPRGAERRRLPGVRRHETRRLLPGDVVPTGLPRTRPAVSAVLAALWATSERQAVYFLVLPVQQRLCTTAALAAVLERVRRHRYRSALWEALADLTGGARSLGELDVGRALARRGLPRPDRQVQRVRADGTVYLDLAWEAYRLTLEVDGAQHDLPWMRLADTLRDLGSLAEGLLVMRLPLLAWRLDEERVLDGIEAVFRSRGWAPAAA